MEVAKLSARGRAALVTWALAHGEELTTAQVAEMTGLSISAARRLMYRLSLRIPVVLWKHVWTVADVGELEG